MARPIPDLGGLNIRGDLTSSILPRLTFSPTIGIATNRINKLGLDIRSFREPLKRSIQRVLAPSFVKNFDSGGRPSWQPLSEGTLEQRRNFGISGDAILIRTGLLRRTMGQLNIWDITPTMAVISHMPDKVWYGAIHQSGLSSGSMAAKIKKHGSARKAFESVQDDIISSMRSGKAIKGSQGIHIPQRQFVLLQDNDIEAIEAIFLDWIEERIDRAWPAGPVMLV
jgi:phage gpG-like protein